MSGIIVKSNQLKISLLSFSIAHMLVDLICVGGVLSLASINGLDGGRAFNYILLYNFIAFGSQPFIGFVVDEKNSGGFVGLFGIGLVIGALLFMKVPLVFVLLAGIGNGCFHVSGGIVSLYYEEGRATAPGLFVAPGAIGVFLGVMLESNIGAFVIASLVLLVVGVVIWKIKIHHQLKYSMMSPGFIEESNQSSLRNFYLVVLALFCVIAFRGIIGGGLFLEWKTTMEAKVLVLTMIVGGKALGGILGDRIGYMKVGIGGLLISLPMLTVWSDHVLLALVGLFAFNLTMPITLTVLSSIFKKYKGFAFGLTTLALIVGYILDLYRSHVDFSGQVMVIAGILISIVCMYIGIKGAMTGDIVLSRYIFVKSDH